MTMTIGYGYDIALDNVCPVFAEAVGLLLRAYGFGAEADKRRTAALGPLVLELRDSRSDTACAKRRGFAITDLARRWAARDLDACGMPVQAAALRACEPITDARTAKAAAAVAEAVAPTPPAAALAAWDAAWAAQAARAGRPLLSAAHAAKTAMYAAVSAGVRSGADGEWDTLDLCVAELLALVKRETARAD